MKIIQSQTNNLAEWQYKELGELLDYEQPTNYIVDSEDYRDYYPTPVLTAGKTFILGHTDENFGVYQKLPVIIFDDFTTAHKFVDFPFKVKSSAMKILKAKKNVNIKFIYGWMQSHPYIVGEHKRNYLSEYQYQDVLLPSFSEQNRIVSVLETWDKAIEKLSKKLEIKKQIKKGLMQDLLTGKKRLMGFSDDWEVKALKDLASVSKGRQLNIENMYGGDYPVINGGITESGYTGTKNTEKNTITISEGGNSCGFVNYISRDFWLGGHCYAVREKEIIDKIFLYFLLKLNELRIMSLRVGSGLPNIQLKSLNSFKFYIPQSKKEQTAIAKILTTADREINIVENKLKIIKEQKRYLLNNLITGTIRTPETLSTKLTKQIYVS